MFRPPPFLLALTGVALALLAGACTSKTTPTRLSVPAALDTPADTGSSAPHLATGPDGAVWLSWLERHGSGHRFRAARLEESGWSAPLTIAAGDSFFVNWADIPTLLPLAGSRLAAHWPWKNGLDVYAYEVRVAQSADGGATWSPPLVPHRDGTPTEHGFVSLLPAATGFRAVWLDGRDFAPQPGAAPGEAGHAEHDTTAAMALRTALIGPDGTLTEEAEIDARTCECCQTAAVQTARGVLVAYRDRGDDEVRDIGVARLEGGRWSEPVPLHRDGWTLEGCPVNGPALDARGDRVAAAWFTSAADTDRVLLAFSNDGGATFGAPIRVDPGSPIGRADVILLEDGSALVLWLEGVGKGPEAKVSVRRVEPGGRKEPVLTVANTTSARSSGLPRMVLDGRRLVLAWTEAGKPSQVKVSQMRLW